MWDSTLFVPPFLAPTRVPQSPYEAVLVDRLSDLHPQLRTYFAAIPAGHVGRGSGVFSVVGTPRRWLWPILWVLQRQGVLFPVWENDVPFVVVNRPVVGGANAVAATRMFHTASGERTMVDAITAESTGLVDHLGHRRRYVAELDAEVVDGALRMASTKLSVRVGRSAIGIPSWIAPTVILTERFDDVTDSQHVAVAVNSRLLGRLYEYAGSFTYEVRPGETE